MSVEHKNIQYSINSNIFFWYNKKGCEFSDINVVENKTSTITSQNKKSYGKCQ